MMNTVIFGLIILTFAAIPSTHGITCHHCELGSDCATDFQETATDCKVCLKYTAKHEDKVEVSRTCASALYAGYMSNSCEKLERGEFELSYCACDTDNCNSCSLLVPSFSFMLLFYLVSCFFQRNN